MRCCVRWLIFVAAVLLLAPSAPATALTPREIREDLTFLREQWAPKNHSFGTAEQQAFEEIVGEGLRLSDGMTDEAFRMTVSRAVAVGRNAHNGVDIFGHPSFAALPIRVWWFSDGLYVTRAREEGLPFLGARIERIGDRTPEEALSRLRPYIAGTDHWARYRSIDWLIRPAALAEAGVVPKAASVGFTFVLPDGKRRTAELRAGATEDALLQQPIWAQALEPTAEGAAWRPGLDSGEPPRSRGTRGEVAAEWLGSDTLYIRMNHIFSLDDHPFEQKLWPILEQVEKKRPRLVIVDLRFNHGGDITTALLFGQGLPRLLSESGRVILLSGRSTMSAAIVLQAMLKGYGGSRAAILGEPLGDNARFWSEGRPLSLPNSKVEVVYNDGLWDVERGCQGEPRCYWIGATYVPPAGPIGPDQTIDWSFREYAAGVDPVLEAALQRRSEP